MDTTEVKQLITNITEGFEAYQKVEEAMEVLERITRNDNYARSYWFAHLKISISPNHGYVSRDSNLLEWLFNKMEEVEAETGQMAETHDGFLKIPEDATEYFETVEEYSQWLDVCNEIRYKFEG